MNHESLHEQIAEAIRASLEEISGSDGNPYWNTTAAAVRVLWVEKELLESALGTGPIYAVWPGEEEHVEGATGAPLGAGRIDAEMDVFVLCLQSYKQTDHAFAPGDPTRWNMGNRMVRDVLRKLLADVQLSGLVENVFATPVIIDRDRWIDGWAVVEIHFRVAYSYTGGVP